MPNDPMLEFRCLAERFIERDVVNAGDAKTRGNAVPQQCSDYGLSAGLLDDGRGDLGHGMRGQGHAYAKSDNCRTTEMPPVWQLLCVKEKTTEAKLPPSF